MKNQKRNLCMLLVVCMALSFYMIGCSQKDASAEDDNASAIMDISTDSKQIELSWYNVGSYPQNDQEAVFAEFNKQLKTKLPNTTVKFNLLGWGDYEDKLKVMIAASDTWDICFVGGAWPLGYSTQVAKGAFLPVDDLMKKYAPKTKAAISDDVWNAARIKGKLYAVINNQVFARTGQLGELNKSLSDEAGFDPKTVKVGYDLEQLEPVYKKIIEKHPDANCGAMNYFIQPEIWGFEFIAGEKVPGTIRMTNSKAKVFNQFESDEVKTYVAKMREYNKLKYFNGTLLATVKDSSDIRKAGKKFAGVGGTWKPGIIGNTNKSNGIEEYNERPITKAYLSTSGITAAMTAIGRNSANPERAMMLIEKMNMDNELINTLNYGMENKHYKKLTANTVKLIANSGYSVGDMFWSWGSYANSWVTPELSTNRWEQTKKINETGIISPLLGFAFDAEPVKTEIAKINAIWEQYYKAIIYGILSEQQYQEFLDKVKAAGSETIIAEMQKQINKFLKK